MRCFEVAGGRAKALWAGHPWVHAGSAREVEGGAPLPPGAADEPDVALVRDAEGRTLGWGLVSEGSAIRVRLLERRPPARPVDEILSARIAAACALRARLFPRPGWTNAYRLVHAEGDGLPGLVVDRYADVLVAQFATSPMHRRRAWLAEALLAASGARSLLSRPGGYEAEEGIGGDAESFAAGLPAPQTVPVAEEGMAFEVEPRLGQKTGHYADQRENRRHVAEVAAGARVLDLYAGSGGFSVQALRHGARTALAVESSARAAAAARRTGTLNATGGRLEVQEADAREVLEGLKAAGGLFDVVVLDPPNFFPRHGGPGRALRAHRDLNVQALTRVEAGGTLATFTCSAALPPLEFRDLVLSAARECRRTLRVLRELAAGPDHPVLAAAPEGRYLTGLLAAVDA